MGITLYRYRQHTAAFRILTLLAIGLLLITISQQFGAWQTQIATHHVTKHNTSIYNILSTAPQLSISQKTLGTHPEDGNVMLKHVEATIHN
jgi:hypothetical protein